MIKKISFTIIGISFLIYLCFLNRNVIGFIGYTTDNNITIEDGFAKLNGLLEEMESDNIGLEASFELYTQGIELVKVLNSKLDDVEGKLNQVLEP